MKIWIDRAMGRLYCDDSAQVIIGARKNQTLVGNNLTIGKNENKAGAKIYASIDLSAVLKAIKANGKYVWLDEPALAPLAKEAGKIPECVCGRLAPGQVGECHECGEVAPLAKDNK